MFPKWRRPYLSARPARPSRGPEEDSALEEKAPSQRTATPAPAAFSTDPSGLAAAAAEADYFPAQLSLLILGQVTGFDIHLRRGENRYVLYREGRLPFTEEVRRELAANGVRDIYIPKGSQRAFLGYLENHLPALLRQKDIAVERKAEVVSETAKHVMEEVFSNPRSPEPVRRARRWVSTTVDLLLREPEAIRHLMSLTTYDFYTFTHSVNVCTLSLGVSMRLYRDDPRHDLRMLGEGFILHDIGKSHIPVEVLNKRGPLTNEEWALMRSHPEEGYAILKEQGPVPEGIAAIVLQHHERVDGRGYPKGLKGEEIHPYAKVCCIADVFDALTTKRPYRRTLTTFDALNLMKKEMAPHFEEEMFRQFVFLFHG